jgi:hypothetical protein
MPRMKTKTPRGLKLPAFTARDQRAAMKEGWLLAQDDRGYRIEVDLDDENRRFTRPDTDRGGSFADEMLAVAYVVGRANAGCERAQRALTLVWEDADDAERVGWMMLGWTPRKPRGSTR